MGALQLPPVYEARDGDRGRGAAQGRTPVLCSGPSTRVQRYVACIAAPPPELNAVPPLLNDGEFPQLSARPPSGSAGAGACGDMGDWRVEIGACAASGKATASGMATMNVYRATGRQVPVVGPALPEAPCSLENQTPSVGDPTGLESRSVSTGACAASDEVAANGMAAPSACMAATSTYRATGRQAPMGGPALPGAPRSYEKQKPSEGDPVVHENRAAVDAGSTGEFSAL